MNISKKLKIGIGAIVKESSSALLEWIAYHRVIGVERFWIADNGCGATTRQLLLDLHRLGIINYIHFPSKSDEGPQLPAYKKILACAHDFGGVLAIIDADEFLMPEKESLQPYLEERFRDKNVSAIALNWACFGSNGALFAENGLIIERFTQRARQTFNPNLQIKSIVRPERVKEFVNPHFATLRQGQYTDSVGDKFISGKSSGISSKVLWNGARINHYLVKSLEEFLVGKHLHGSAATPNTIKHKRYFTSHDRNDEECLLITRFAPQVHAEISRLNTKRDQLLSCLHPAQLQPYQSLDNIAGLQWMFTPQLSAAATGAVAGYARTPILHDPTFEQHRLLVELSIFSERLFRSSQYRFGSKIGALIRTLLGRAEKRSLPEIKIRQALEEYRQLRKIP